MQTLLGCHNRTPNFSPTGTAMLACLWERHGFPQYFMKRLSIFLGMIITVKIKFKEKERKIRIKIKKLWTIFILEWTWHTKQVLLQLTDTYNSKTVQDVWGMMANRHRQMFGKDVSSNSLPPNWRFLPCEDIVYMQSQRS